MFTATDSLVTTSVKLFNLNLLIKTIKKKKHCINAYNLGSDKMYIACKQLQLAKFKYSRVVNVLGLEYIYNIQGVVPRIYKLWNLLT